MPDYTRQSLPEITDGWVLRRAGEVVEFGLIVPGAISFPADSVLYGRAQGAGAGPGGPITLGTNLTMVGSVLNASGGGSASVTATTITVSYGTRETSIVIVDAGVTIASKIVLVPGGYVQTEVNDPIDADITVENIGTGTFTVKVRAKGREAIGGPFNLFYILG